MKLITTTVVWSVVSLVAHSQNGDPMVVNKLPDYILPAPEASNLIKADNIAVGYSTGSPNVNIPLASLGINGFNWPLSLSYSSTGVKIDEYASMVGMGWNITYGGVVSRTVLDHPDELRDPNNCNLNTYNFNSPGTAEHNFLRNALDKESDIFNFSFGGYNGKFIIGLNNQAAQITKNNIKIEFVNSNFLNGFIIRTDDGTAYHFEDAEISTSRNPAGTNCEKTYDNSSVKTSWYLTKIVLPSTTKQINFTYIGVANVAFQSSISQTISRVTWSETNPCSSSPACAIGSERFSTCISRQVVSSKYISAIVTSDGDKISFFYDGVSRADLENGKRLSSLRLINRNGLLIREVTFNSTYITATTGTGWNICDQKRLFLQDIKIKGGEITGAMTPLQYTFEYDSYSSLPARLSYSQDFYGYYNGKNSNASLIPKLQSTDVNYSIYNNGTGGTSVQFGDRSIDPAYSAKGLLTKVTYPTGGYETIEYAPNKVLALVGSVETEILAGGHSVWKIKSFTFAGNMVLEKEFIYRNMSDNKLSSFLLTKSLRFSQSTMTRKDGGICGSIPYTEGPACNYAVVTSNANYPITTYGSQHIYHASVLEKIKNGSDDNGIIEHNYSYFASGNLGPRYWFGNHILNTPYQVVPDLLIGERTTKVYKRIGSAYSLRKSTENVMVIDGLTEYHNYTVKKNYERVTIENPPVTATFNPYDVEEYYINVYTIRTNQVIEKEYDDSGAELSSTTSMSYSPLYTYPKIITKINSAGIQSRTERKYAPDYGTLNFMLNRNIISPVIEEKFYRNASDLQYTKTQTFQDWFGNTTVIAPQNIDLKIAANTQTQKVIFNSYDIYGNVKDVSKEQDQHFSFIWGYSANYPLAKVQNAAAGNVAYTSFETAETGNWVFTGGSVLTTGGLTGRMSYALASGNSISRSSLTSGNYKITYWSKNGSMTVNSSNTGTVGETRNGWTYYEHTVNGITSVNITGAGTIDELRLYPVTALMTTFTYEPQLGMTSQIDVNNRISYYEYDGLGRLILIRDQDKNIVKKICYNYAGQPENCDVFYNDIASQVFTKACSAGYTGSQVTYTVPAGIYNGYTPEDANAKATNDIATNGQAFANANGVCTLTGPVCTPSNCTGVDKKCINGVCQTGVKVYTSSVQIGPHLWECTYHYEWSDGSWSQNYTEQQPNSSFCQNIVE